MSTRRKSSRRDFLQRSTAAVAAATVAGPLSVARGAHAVGSDALRVALVGCGARGNGAVQNCLNADEGAILVAVADAFQDSAKNSALALRAAFKDRAQLPGERVFSGFEGFEKVLKCDADLVILATPPGFRPLHYTAAVKAGKHVFMEKPCCVDAVGYRQVMEANRLADEKNLKVGVGLQRRHDVSYIEGVKQIHDGAVGDVLFMSCYWNGNTPWIRRRQESEKEMEYQMRNWYFFAWLSGDNIVEQHVHNLDVINWVKNDHPVEASGMGGRQVRRGKEVGHVFDHHVVEFTYQDGTRLFSQCRQMPGVWNHVAESVNGTRGVSTCRAGGGGKNPYDQEHIDLVSAIRKDAKYNEGWFGATSSMTAVLGRMATYSGQVVTWEDAVAKGASQMPKRLAWDSTPPIVPDKDGLYEHAVPVPGVYKPYS